MRYNNVCIGKKSQGKNSGSVGIKVRGLVPMKKQKLSLFILAACLMLLLGACSNDSGNSEGKQGSSDVIKVYIAHGNQADEPIGKLAEKWKELAEEKSGGKLEITVFPSSQLGSEKHVVEQALMGNNVIAFTGYDFLKDYVPDAGILTAPYLVDSVDEVLKLTTTEWFEDLESQLEEKNISIMNTTTVYGERHLMTAKPVKTVEDLKGLKIRVPNNQMYIKTFEALGASPTPMPLSDLYTSLQQGLIDGAENPLPVLEGAKVNEVVNNLTLTEHTKIISPWIAGKNYLDTLPDEMVDILRETGNEAAEFAREMMEAENQRVLELFKEQGIEVHEVDLESFKEKTKVFYDSFPEWSDGLYETVQSMIKENK